MANYYLRMNLASAIWPFFTQAAGRTIVIPGLDENFDRYNAANTVADKGVPQVFYMHNVVPIAGGFQSVGYQQLLPGLPGHTDFGTCFSLLSETAANVLFVPADGMNYIFDGTNATWQSVSPLTPVKIGSLVTTAYVKGVTYIYYEQLGCFKYNTSTQTLDPVVLSGLTASDIIGICESNGYMIAWSATNVVWSSVSNPTDFVPSIQTGAGGGSLLERKGKINFCVKLSTGFIVCCDENIVSMQYTTNQDFPFISKVVPGSAGIQDINNVAYQGNLPYFPALTMAGMQQVSLFDAIPTMQEVSDFITSGVFEDFDDTTNTFSEVSSGGALGVKLASVSNRWIVISYGLAPPDYTHAIIYDIALNRYGRLKLPHRCAFQFRVPEPSGWITYDMLMATAVDDLNTTTYQELYNNVNAPPGIPKENLAFIQQDGTVLLVEFDVNASDSNGTFIIGKFQHQRDAVITHQITEIETLKSANNFELLVLPTLDGKDWLPAVATTVIQKATNMSRFAGRVTGKNISIILKGSFNLTTSILRYTIGGWR